MPKTYRFKYDNVDLESYIKERRFVAEQKREEARQLCKVADAIDSEMDILRIQFKQIGDEAQQP